MTTKTAINTATVKSDATTANAEPKKTGTTKPGMGKSRFSAKPKATLPKKSDTSADIEKVVNNPTSGVIVFEKEFVQKFRQHDAAICKGFKTASKSFFEIALNLHWIYKHDAFKTAGKDNIYDYARDRFDVSRGTTHNYIAIAERFGRPALESDMLVIRDEYAAYSPTQLSILAPHTDAEIKALEISPTMSTRDIKKKFLAAIEDKKAGNDSDVITEPEEDEVEEPVQSAPSAPTPDRNVLITCTGKDDYLSHEEAVFDLIHNLLTKKPDARIEISYFVGV